MKFFIFLIIPLLLSACAQSSAKDDPHATKVSGKIIKIEKVQPSVQAMPSVPNVNTGSTTAAYTGAIVANAYLNRPFFICHIQADSGEIIKVKRGCLQNMAVGSCTNVWITPIDQNGNSKTFMEQTNKCAEILL